MRCSRFAALVLGAWVCWVLMAALRPELLHCCLSVGTCSATAAQKAQPVLSHLLHQTGASRARLAPHPAQKPCTLADHPNEPRSIGLLIPASHAAASLRRAGAGAATAASTARRCGSTQGPPPLPWAATRTKSPPNIPCCLESPGARPIDLADFAPSPQGRRGPCEAINNTHSSNQARCWPLQAAGSPWQGGAKPPGLPALAPSLPARALTWPSLGSTAHQSAPGPQAHPVPAAAAALPSPLTPCPVHCTFPGLAAAAGSGVD